MEEKNQVSHQDDEKEEEKREEKNESFNSPCSFPQLVWDIVGYYDWISRCFQKYTVVDVSLMKNFP